MEASSGLKPNEGLQLEVPVVPQAPLAGSPPPGGPRLDSAAASASGAIEPEKPVALLEPAEPREPGKKTVRFPDDVDRPAAEARENLLRSRTIGEHPLERMEWLLKRHLPESRSDGKDDGDRASDAGVEPDAPGLAAPRPKPREVEPVKALARKMRKAIIRESMTPDQARERLDKLGLPTAEARKQCAQEVHGQLLTAAKRDEDIRWKLLEEGHLTFEAVAGIHKLDYHDCKEGLRGDPGRLKDLGQLLARGLLDQGTYNYAAAYAARLARRE